MATSARNPSTTSKCRLCQREEELSKSHIIPEFLYLTTYDDIHRAVKVTPERTEQPPYIQKGMREYLLCRECEAQLSEYEGYTSRLLNSIREAEPKANERYVEVSDIDYKLFKLFQMSLLWRASVTSLKGFETVSLGPHEEKLRLRIRDENPGEPFENACFLMMYPRGGDVEKVLFTPVREEFAGKVYYRFHTGPWFWYFIHPGQFQTGGESDLIVSRSGNLKIVIAQWSENEYMNNLRNLIIKKDTH